jgi:pantoate--beta-alanine ligase
VHETTVHLALGSNLGDRQQNLDAALRDLRTVPGITVVAVSRFRETEPVGGAPGQGKFLNGVAELRTTLTAHALLGVCKALESKAGRALPAPRHQARPLDVDIVFFGDEVIDTADLIVPHPRWHEREFVKEPLRELGVDLEARPRHSGPLVCEQTAEFAALSSRWQAGRCVVGLVPTMGALHAGHRSLMEIARAECDRVAVTIFVNPLQFGPKEDLAAYPRDLAGDLKVCAAAGVDAVFAPSVAQMYDPDFCSHVAVGAAAETMEGAIRPDHFRGVATVVARLFAIGRPHRAYFGEKDAQQLAVITRMTRDLGFPIQIVRCAIVREPDGLAMSSRNVFLEAGDRKASTVIYRALCHARELFARGTHDRDTLLQRAREVLASEPRAEVDYVELRREGDLQPLPGGTVDGGRLLVAARFSRGSRPVRLLDNMSLAHVEAS